MARKKTSTWAVLRAYALSLPGATEDFPWGETVVKVNKKIFVFLGVDGGEQPRISIKLAESCDFALAVPGSSPTGYGLGRAGWVTIPVGANAPPLGILKDWIAESYRLVAPKRLLARVRPER